MNPIALLLLAGIAFTNVTVVDVEEGALRPGLTVEIRDGKVARIGSDLELDEKVETVDGSGKFLIPGLWDMHVHWYAEDYLPLFTANGVTGIRQMFGQPMHLEWREKIEAGELQGPRIVVASRIVDGPQPIWPGSIKAGDAGAGQAAVGTALREGADFVKVYSLLPRDAYFAIAERATKKELPFAGHVPVSVTAGEASDAGQLTIEHLSGVLLSTSAEEEARRAKLSAGGSWSEAIDGLAASHDAQKAEVLYEKFAKNGTWHCPTLTVLRNTALLPDKSISDDPNLAYMPPQVRAMWSPAGGARWTDAAAYETSLKIVGRMHRAGVKILAGTDALNPYCFPGFSLHGELELLVEAGLSPLDALRAATLNPAEMLGRTEELGSVAAGKRADLVLLDANPLEKIGNTRKIAAVVLDGQLIEREQLDAMLAEVERRASRSERPGS